MAKLPALAQHQVPRLPTESSMPPSKTAVVTPTKKIKIVIPSEARNLLFLSAEAVRGERTQ
jgi:hypothetical protein